MNEKTYIINKGTQNNFEKDYINYLRVYGDLYYSIEEVGKLEHKLLKDYDITISQLKNNKFIYVRKHLKDNEY